MTAENSATVSGEQTTHLASTSSTGAAAGFRGTWTTRIGGTFPDAISASALSACRTAHCMLDCPDPTHTSPTRTSATVTVFPPGMVISAAGPGRQPHLPAAQWIGDGLDGLAAERDRHGLAW